MVLVAAALLCVACVTQAPRPQVAGAQSATPADPQARNVKMVCRMERPTGSNIPERICRPEGEDTRDQQELQERMLQMRSVSTRPNG
jgi:hypothetical protein